jgi:hypothetical protein
MITFNNHYWIIAGSTTDVYSSATNTLVPVDDQTYVDWSANNAPSPIISEAELADVVRPYNLIPAWMFNAASFIQPTPTTYTKAQLAAYAADARYRRASGGLTITGISAAPFFTDPVARNTLANANEYAKVTPHTTDWKMSDGSFIPLSPSQLSTATDKMANFVQACFTAESTTVASINSSSITTLAQIDAAFAAVANVVP